MKPLRIGTRGSPLALAQAYMVEDALKASGAVTEVVVMSTSGDRIIDRALMDIGGKGLFTQEIEDALLAGRLDVAVHSAKDMPTELPEGLILAGYLPREDVRDCLVTTSGQKLTELPYGAKVGTASLRRGALVRRLRPDLRVEVFRGNVQTRLTKLRDGVVAATLLARAGLRRLGLEDVATEVLDINAFPPAVGQGAIAIETRAGDAAIAAALAPALCRKTAQEVATERAFLAALDGSCRTPIAGHAIVFEGEVRFSGLILTPDGTRSHSTQFAGDATDGPRLGFAAGQQLRAVAGERFFESW